MTFSSDTSRWQAVCHRAHAAHSAFVYGVTTTRIFCRPTCPARLARRSNVIFFDTATAAATAGFRACKRCKPGTAVLAPDDQRGDVVRKACAFMTQCRGETTTAKVAAHVGLSTRYFHGIFKQGMGLGPAEYAKQCRQAVLEQRESKISQPPAPLAQSSDCYVPRVLGGVDLNMDFEQVAWEWLDTANSSPEGTVELPIFPTDLDTSLEMPALDQLDWIDIAGYIPVEDVSAQKLDGNQSLVDVPFDWLPVEGIRDENFF